MWDPPLPHLWIAPLPKRVEILPKEWRAEVSISKLSQIIPKEWRYRLLLGLLFTNVNIFINFSNWSLQWESLEICLIS